MAGPIHNFSESNRLNGRLHDLIPGGSHTYSKGEDQFPALSPKVMAQAEGAYCWDVDGNRYIDWAMGNRVMVLGHAYPSVNEAVIRQIGKGLNFSRPSILEYELAEYLTSLFPVAEMVKFGKNGSDVTSAAIKLSRAYTGRKYVACCSEHPFFSINDWFIGITPMQAGVPEEVAALTLQFHYNEIESVKALFEQYPGQIAALILEPVKLDPPREDFLPELRRLCTQNGTVLIFDEMISGIRFDLRGAHHLWGVYPDLACFGKAISNGYSFSMLAGKRELMRLGGMHHDQRRVFLLSQTHSSETVGLAACRATLEECQAKAVTEHIWRLGNKLKSEFCQLAQAEGVAEYVRMIGYDCNPQIVCTHEDGTAWPELNAVFHEELISCGVIIPWITITLSHGEEEVRHTLTACQQGMDRVKKEISSETVNELYRDQAPKPVFRSFNRCRQSRCGRLHPVGQQLDCCHDAGEIS